MNRSDLQQLAELRLSEAQVLLDAGKFAGAYYLAGYAIECAMKACIAKRTREFDFPEKGIVNRSHTHDLRQLVDVAGMDTELKVAIAKDVKFAEYWEVISRWSETSRGIKLMSMRLRRSSCSRPWGVNRTECWHG